VYLPTDLHHRFYHGFCKHYLWPLLHYLLPLTPSSLGGLPFQRTLYHSFLSANRAFADRLTDVLSPDEDLVWIHVYHLLALPTFLRKRFPRAKVGFFLHSPFPSSEIFRTIPMRDDLVRALLNADLVGFHTFDYTRHFLTACSRRLDLDYQSKRGYIGIEYYGRTVTVKILLVGIDMGHRCSPDPTMNPLSTAASGGVPHPSLRPVLRRRGSIPTLGCLCAFLATAHGRPVAEV
jgi:trehalose 6-phosphate synthase/phosphatase